ncbi:MAG TPA: PocR ligand-binding domain-containing protein [Desulfuromonadaceae bacterium]|jgi:PAS domain S-box-containing protein
MITSFKMKALLFMIPVLVIVSLVYTYESIKTEKEIIRNEIIKRAETVTTLATKTGELPILSRNQELLKSTVAFLRTNSEVSSVTLYDNRMEPLIHDGPPITAKSPAKPPDLPISMSEDNHSFVFYAPVYTLSAKEDFDFFQEDSVSQVKQNIGWIRLSFSKSSMLENEQKIVARGLMLAVIFTSASSILVYFLITLATRPLNRIVVVANAIAHGDFSQEIKSERQDEIGVLSQAFSTMKQTIQQVLHETDGLILAVRDGKLNIRSNAEIFEGEWRTLVAGVNQLSDTFASNNIELQRAKDSAEELTGRLQEAKASLEKRVVERTEELLKANLQLEGEIAERKLIEEALARRLIALTSPLGDVSEIQFDDLFDLEEIQRIQDSFSSATGVASIITDPHGNPITRLSNCSLLCRSIRATEKGLTNCQNSDALIGSMNPDGPLFQPCLSGGLWDGGASIRVGEHHIANWLIGQVLDESGDTEKIMEYVREIGADQQVCRQSLENITRMPRERFAQICQALFLIAGQLSNLAIQNVQQARYISESKRAEEELRNSKEFTENVIQSANALIICLDLLGRITMLNRAAEEVLGYCAAELSGRDFDVLIPDGSQLGSDDDSQKILSRGTPDIFESQMLAKNGAHRMISWRSSPIAENGQVVGTIFFGIDTTEHRKLEEQLRHALKMESIGRLAGGVAHDFNNQLTVILGYAELSQDRLSPEDKLWQNLKEIIKAAEHSRDITRQLLAFSRQQIVSPQQLDLNKAIGETQRTLSRLIGEEIKLFFTPVEKLWLVEIDPGQLDQIVMNLAVNARDAMPGGGTLTISLAPVHVDEAFCLENVSIEPGDYVRMTFQDNGTGMSAETLQHLFEPFFTTKEVGKGTGLGLATVYGIVTQNKGFIRVLSKLGVGTTFEIHLPRLAKEETMRHPKGESKAPRGTGTILLVEDDETVRGMAAKMLEHMGYAVHPVCAPAEAIDFCEDHDHVIDMILSDVVMPGMSGREMIEKIEAGRPGIKVLYMSGYTSDIISQKGVLEEGMHFIQKPFDANGLSNKIKQVLSNNEPA